ncbi:MAG: hydrogenase expression protein HypE [Rhodomicrobium sp.]
MNEAVSGTLIDRAGHQVADRDGFVRLAVSESEWIALARSCAEGEQDLTALWIDGVRARTALMSRDRTKKVIASVDCAGGRYPSVGLHHAPAIRLERAMRDLYGVEPEGLPDERGWLDHGVWPESYGRAGRPSKREPYRFLAAEGQGLHQIPVGPIHAGIIEPGHFRFTANGETVVRLEERLGYVHKGVESLFAGKNIDGAAKLAARISGDSTVAYSFAFARALEAAAGIQVPQSAVYLRGIMAELERIANHINDVGAICNDASAVAVHAHCTLLREKILQFCGRCFGHRLMMDRIVPGGVTVDLSDEGIAGLRRLIKECERDFKDAVRAYDGMPSILDRTVKTGCVSAALVREFGAGGFVGRASARNFDCRRDAAYPPYDGLSFAVPLRQEEDVNARTWIRIDEVGESIGLIRKLLDLLEPGPVAAEVPIASESEGAALVESFRGDIFVSVRLDPNGRVGHCHMRDASCFQWPLLEAAIEGNIVADFPLCNKSFNCSYSGHDM